MDEVWDGECTVKSILIGIKLGRDVEKVGHHAFAVLGADRLWVELNSMVRECLVSKPHEDLGAEDSVQV
jgi:hypothetical protein